DGLPIFDDVSAHRRRLGYLPQDFGVYPGLSARELLDHLALLKGVTDRHSRREQVDALLVQVNLWEHRTRAVSGFSGGMRQRFGIARRCWGTRNWSSSMSRRRGSIRPSAAASTTCSANSVTRWS
ncbi:MAG: ATP-binding cassette domain-containing protein, partial [Bryobacterales bacterium]|nr:ATP-binding cassette domain-containing protein [Bryobacterales bacterium]